MMEELKRYHHPKATAIIVFLVVMAIVALAQGEPGFFTFFLIGSVLCKWALYRQERRWRDERAQP